MTSSNISRNTPTHTRSSPATITTYNISRAHTRTHTHTHTYTRTCAHTHTHTIPTQQLAQAIQFFSYFHNFGTHLLQSEVDAALWEKLWRKYLHFLGQQHRCRSNSRAGCLESRLTRMTSCCSLPLKLLLLLLLYSPLLTSPRVEGQGMCRNPVLRWWQSVQCHRKEEPVRSLKVKDQFIGWEPFGKAGRRGEFSHNTSFQWVIQKSYGKENQNWWEPVGRGVPCSSAASIQLIIQKSNEWIKTDGNPWGEGGKLMLKKELSVSPSLKQLQ